jgi:hypothetical protein
MKNWQTTVAGIVFTIGNAFVASDDLVLRQVGQILVAAGGLFGFYFAKDKGVTGVGKDARRESEY